MARRQYVNQRKVLEKTQKAYASYLDLYRYLNNGSLQGAIAFEKFYWSYQFDFKYNQLKHN